MQIELKNIGLTYDCSGKKAPVLHDISLQIEKGECVGIMGRTGCGKTSLVQLIAGLLAPTEGKILIDGQDIHARSFNKIRLREKIGYVFQYPEYQLFETTVYRDVAFALKHSKLSKKEKEARVKAALEDMGFEFDQIRDVPPLTLSGGEKRRVAIAGVLASQPEILILDEPIAGLDPKARAAFLKLLKKLQARGTTILVISHNADAIGQCADRLIVIDEGKKAMDGPLQECFAQQDKLCRMHLDVSFASRLSQKLPDFPHCVTYDDLILQLKNRMGGAR